MVQCEGLSIDMLHRSPSSALPSRECRAMRLFASSVLGSLHPPNKPIRMPQRVSHLPLMILGKWRRELADWKEGSQLVGLLDSAFHYRKRVSIKHPYATEYMDSG